MRVQGVRAKIRLHHKDGRIITETLTHMARENVCTVAEARTLIRLWCEEGSLRLRGDGGFDVIRFKGRGTDVARVRSLISEASELDMDVGDVIRAHVHNLTLVQ